MENRKPKISMLIFTYNRAHLVERAIKSVLNQTYRDFELILVNNGSTDNTSEIVDKYDGHENVRTFHLKENIGFQGALKFGVSKIQGEWFTQLSDDDTIMEDAFETLLKVPEEIDPKINAVTCNAIDSSTGEFAGMGLLKDQFVPVEVIMQKTHGEFFGITKSELLNGIFIKEDVPGYDDVFWHKIDVKANRYYIHKALKTWTTDHGPTLTAGYRIASLKVKSNTYGSLAKDDEYWDILKKYNPKRYVARCLRGLLFVKMARNSEAVTKYKKLLNSTHLNFKSKFLFIMFSSIDRRFLVAIYNLFIKFPNLWVFTRVFFKRYNQIKG